MGWTDPLDQASELEAIHNASSLAAARAKSKPEQVQNPDGTWPTTECVACGEDIEPARISMGKVRCIHCQTLHEKNEKLYGR